jgi:hypothetical protein
MADNAGKEVSFLFVAARRKVSIQANEDNSHPLIAFLRSKEEMWSEPIRQEINGCHNTPVRRGSRLGTLRLTEADDVPAIVSEAKTNAAVAPRPNRSAGRCTTVEAAHA